MVQIDHPDLPQSEPQPALPILASHLLHLEQKHRTRFTRDGLPERLSTHCEDIDEIFGGGIERGVVVGISSEGVEGRLISLNLLSSVLLSHLPLDLKPGQPTPTKATIIDTTGSFPLRLLAQILKSRITASHALSSRTANQSANYPITKFASKIQNGKTEEELKIEKEVQQCLQMISISRVFDIEGLWEVLGEIGHESPNSDDKYSSTEVPVSEQVEPKPDQDQVFVEVAKVSDAPIQSSPDWLEESAEIHDSQDEEEEREPVNVEDDHNPEKPPEENAEMEKDEGIEIVIIDNMTQILNELFSRKEKGDAHHLLTLLSRHIHTLSTTHNILTILHNTTTSSKPSYPTSNNYPPNQYQQSRPQQQKAPKSNPQPTSLFPSNPLKPALGSLFSQFPSLHIFISRLPKTREDAEVLYTSHDRDRDGGEGKVGYVSVVEILIDECPSLPTMGEGGGKDEERKEKMRKLGYREQLWCPVSITPDGTGLKAAFETRGGMKSMGMERKGVGRGAVDPGVDGSDGGIENERGVARGNIVKIWGFGGRRA